MSKQEKRKVVTVNDINTRHNKKPAQKMLSFEEADELIEAQKKKTRLTQEVLSETTKQLKELERDNLQLKEENRLLKEENEKVKAAYLKVTGGS